MNAITSGTCGSDALTYSSGIASTAPRARQLTHDEIHEIEHEKTHYPYSQAVGLEALKIVQKYQGWVSDESLLAVAEYLKIPADDLEGVATFFNLIYRRPVGKNVILFCDSVACWMLMRSISSRPTYSPMQVVETLTHCLFHRMPPLALT